jgi:DNA-binding IclR family transcriptional regulator
LSDDDQRERRRIQSVNVGFTLIRHLATSPSALSLKELGEATGMSASQVHMYMASFTLEGLAVQDPATARYDLGPYALELGLAAMRKLDVLEIAKSPMLALRDEAGLSVFLTVWGNHGATIVSKVDANRRSPMVLRVGYVLPTLDSATGRLYLALLPDDATRHIVDRELADPTIPTLTSDQIKAIVDRTKRTGLGTHEESRIDGFTGIAAPLLDANGSLRAALTVTGPAQDFADGADGAIAAVLRTTANEISTRLGYRQA